MRQSKASSAAFLQGKQKIHLAAAKARPIKKAFRGYFKVSIALVYLLLIVGFPAQAADVFTESSTSSAVSSSANPTAPISSSSVNIGGQSAVLPASANLPFYASASLPASGVSSNKTTGVVKQNYTKPTPIIAPSKPRWSDLNIMQKYALGPLESEWDKLDETRKKKWLEIAQRFPTMTLDERQRLHERLYAWLKLTPEQRQQARINFQRAKQLTAEEKQRQWELYQQLSEEHKRALAKEAAQRSEPTKKKLGIPDPILQKQ